MGQTSNPNCSVEQLRCEYLAEPLGLDVPHPQLLWKVKVDGRGESQTAFEVLVASSLEKLAKGEGDLWHSGKVAGESFETPYQGAELKSSQQAFWKVRVWNRKDQPSSWSQPAAWSMGLLQASDWKGKWLGSTTGALFEPAPFFRKTFPVDKPIKRATATICGLGYYELHLNGAKVGDHVLDPAYTRYDLRCLYVTYDVTRQLAQGSNAVGVVLGNGWYNYQATNAWAFEKAPWRHQPEVLAQILVEFADGSTQVIATDDTWKYSNGPIQYDGFLNGEIYDARLEKTGWDTANFDDAQWENAKVVPAPKGKLTPQVAPPIRITGTIKPVKITQPKPGVYVVDLGQNIAGAAQLKVSGPAGTKVKLQYAELLHPDGTINNANIAEHCRFGEFQTDYYILKGQGTEVWQPRFMYYGYQYIQVTGFPGEPTLDNFLGLVMHTDLESVGSFECSNEVLTKIQECTRWSYLNNFHGHPTDCPNRERNGWTGDAHLAIETGLYNFNGIAAYAKWMRDFQDEQRATGELPGIVPTGGWGYAWGNGPAWDSAYILIPWAMYQFRNDDRILADHYENLKRYVDYLTTRAENGIVGIGLGDWCPAKTTTPEKVTSTGYYYKDAQTVAKIASRLGRKEDAKKYGDLAATIKAAFNREFFDAKTGQIANGSQTALSCALYQGLVDGTNRAVVLSNLVANVEARQGHLDCGILGAKYLLHALTDNGRADLAYTVASQTTFPSWGNWVKQGATTLWEGWDGSGTHNHIMFGDISAWFYSTLGGINPRSEMADGFKHIDINPQFLGDLTWVKSSYETIRGSVVSNWKRNGNKIRMEITVPPNSEARVFIPTRNVDGITESGKTIKDAGLEVLSAVSQGRVCVRVTSGSYVFESEM